MSSRSVLLTALIPVFLVAAADAQSPMEARSRFGRRVDLHADNRNRTVVTTVGQVVDIRLANMGPAIYDSLPRLSSKALAFIGVDIVPPHVPSGPIQRFRFRAVRAGRVIVTFTRRMPALTTTTGTVPDSVVAIVEDTVQIRPRTRPPRR
jgi:hypothetical protein